MFPLASILLLLLLFLFPGPQQRAIPPPSPVPSPPPLNESSVHRFPEASSQPFLSAATHTSSPTSNVLLRIDCRATSSSKSHWPRCSSFVRCHRHWQLGIIRHSFVVFQLLLPTAQHSPCWPPPQSQHPAMALPLASH